VNQAAKILGFSLDMKDFGEAGQSILFQPTKVLNEIAKKNLDRLVQNVSESNPAKPADVGEVYRKFMELAPYGKGKLLSEFDTSRKVRKLAWSLDYSEDGTRPIIHSAFLDAALTVINGRWRAYMIAALIDALLRNWSKMQDEGGIRLRNFILDKLRSYEGRRESLRLLQTNLQYLETARGPLVYALYLLKNRSELSDAPTYMGLPGYMILNFEYFSQVGRAFTQFSLREDDFETRLDGIYDFLKKHQNKDTSKFCLGRIILEADKNTNDSMQEKAKQVAVELVGDPEYRENWAPWDLASEEEKKQLEAARRILNEWLTRDFLDIFFERLANMDTARKTFWLKYTRHISRFKIYGTEMTRRMLATDRRIRDLLEPRFGYLRDSDARQSALLMVVNNYLLAEFSQTGAAFYAYLRSNPLAPDISKEVLSSGSIRKAGQMDQLMRRRGRQRYNVRQEGRFSHMSGWEYHLSWWLTNHLGI
jgi:hypothetical protein